MKLCLISAVNYLNILGPMKFNVLETNSLFVSVGNFKMCYIKVKSIAINITWCISTSNVKQYQYYVNKYTYILKIKSKVPQKVVSWTTAIELVW